MAYQAFAQLYDSLMYDQPYEQWAEITMTFANPTDRVLDAACGTGNVITLLPDTMQRVGLDLSEEMLAVAQAKDHKVEWIAQNMVEMDIGQSFDVITCYCDSLNYLVSTADIVEFFYRVKEHLAADGTFIFDVHSLWKMNHLFNGQTYSDETEEVTYLWNAVPGEEEGSVWHDMSFFVHVDADLYRRFDESHFQKTFSPEVYMQLLQQTGLKVVQQFADFDMTSPVAPDAERIFFVVKHND